MQSLEYGLKRTYNNPNNANRLNGTMWAHLNPVLAHLPHDRKQRTEVFIP
jgi:hypothetical protein